MKDVILYARELVSYLLRQERHLFCWNIKLSKHKFIEIESGKWDWDNSSYWEFITQFSRARDHAGITVSLELFGIYLIFNLYDHRHWDYDKKRYYEYAERKKEDDKFYEL